MHVVGDFQVHQPREAVWSFFADAQKLVDCLDDPHTVEVLDEKHFRGTLTTGVAFIRGTFQISGEYAERTPPDRLVAKLHGTGMGNGLDATISTQFAGDASSTAVHWEADFTFSGSVASMGERILRGTLEKKIQGLFVNARQRLGG
jgi:carbon monoxide dehydrogenase subunit G